MSSKDIELTTPMRVRLFIADLFTGTMLPTSLDPKHILLDVETTHDDGSVACWSVELLPDAVRAFQYLGDDYWIRRSILSTTDARHIECTIGFSVESGRLIKLLDPAPRQTSYVYLVSGEVTHLLHLA